MQPRHFWPFPLTTNSHVPITRAYALLLAVSSPAVFCTLLRRPARALLYLNQLYMNAKLVHIPTDLGGSQSPEPRNRAHSHSSAGRDPSASAAIIRYRRTTSASRLRLCRQPGTHSLSLRRNGTLAIVIVLHAPLSLTYRS